MSDTDVKEVVMMDITDIAKYMDNLKAEQERRGKIINALTAIVFIVSISFAFALAQKQNEIDSITNSVVRHEEALLTQSSKLDMTIDTVVANKSELDKTAERLKGIQSEVDATSDGLQSLSKKVTQQGSQISQIKKGIEAGPEQTVVIAATDDQAKKAAFDRWTKQNPDWKEYRSCIRMNMGSNPGLSLNEAYKTCKEGK